ncbi:MAG TPA: hypothetical protein VE221_00750 [Sphingomicrobium sp.]|nr:hypothetical protein [Sphingomicrobium sp.]
MANFSTARTPPHRGDLPLQQDLLRELEQAHVRLNDCMSEMDEATRERVPDCFRYTRARFMLSSASLARRQLFNSICEHLFPLLSLADVPRVQSLQQADRELLGLSAKHVAQWTSDTVQCDWPGYCRASRQIRKHMRDALDSELRVLAPLLQRHGCDGRKRQFQ